MQRLRDAVDLGLRDSPRLIVASLQDLYLETAVLGVEVQLQYVRPDLRIAVLKTFVVLGFNVEDSGLCGTRSARVTNLLKMR